MILRALFWIAVVGVLMPREPDLGLGRPGAAAPMLPSAMAMWLDKAAGAPQVACNEHADDCAQALGLVDALQNAAVRSLAEVKAEIEASKRERAARRLASND